MMSGGMVFHSPSFRYCHWSERSSPTLKRVLNSVVAARFPRNTEAFPRGRGHFLRVEPLVVRHRRIVTVSTKGEQKKNTGHQRYAVERFHGSLRYGLSFIFSIRESHELSGH